MTKKKVILSLVLIVVVSVSIVAILSYQRTLTPGYAELRALEEEISRLEKEGALAYDDEGKLTGKAEKLFRRIDELMARKKTSTWMLKRFASRWTPLFYRHMLAEIIAEQKDPTAVGTLIKVLKNKRQNEGARADAAFTLGMIGDERAVEPLIEALSDEAIQEDVIRGLIMFKDERAAEPLLEMLKSGDSTKRLLAARGLKVDNPEVVEALIDLARDDPEMPVRAEALRSLGATKDEQAFQSLMDVIQDESRASFEKSYAINALGEIADKRAVEPLIKILDEDDLLYRDAAIALGELGDKRAIEPLKKRMEEKKDKAYIMKDLRAAYRKLTQKM